MFGKLVVFSPQRQFYPKFWPFLAFLDQCGKTKNKNTDHCAIVCFYCRINEIVAETAGAGGVKARSLAEEAKLLKASLLI